jgi:hypothetical protein
MTPHIEQAPRFLAVMDSNSAPPTITTSTKPEHLTKQED